MAKVFIEVAEGDDDFTVLRDGNSFVLREGESILLVGESHVHVDGSPGVYLFYPADIDPSGAAAAPAPAPEPSPSDEVAVPANDVGEPDPVHADVAAAMAAAPINLMAA